MKKIIIRMLGAYLNALAFIAPSYAARKGFVLFCRPSRVPPTKKQLAFLDTATRFQLDCEDGNVQVYQWGHGKKKILFLHGWQSHTYRWKPYIEALPKDEYTIYSLDAPGHGLSSGNFLSVPLYSSIIEDFLRQHNDIHTIAGHSLGGFSLLYTLYRLPVVHVDRIILLSPPGEASDFIAVFKRTLGLSERTAALIVSHFAKRYHVTPEFFSARRFASSLTASGLIIHDEGDLEAPYAYSIPLHQQWRESKLVTTKGLGHNLKSTSVVKEVVDFIRLPVHQESL